MSIKAHESKGKIFFNKRLNNQIQLKNIPLPWKKWCKMSMKILCFTTINQLVNLKIAL